MKMKKVIKINAPEDRRYGFTSSVVWNAGYSILAGNESVKYIQIDFREGIYVVVSKIYLPSSGGFRYFVSVPARNFAAKMQESLMDPERILFAILYDRDRHIGIPLEEALTISQVLHDLGDF